MKSDKILKNNPENKIIKNKFILLTTIIIIILFIVGFIFYKSMLLFKYYVEPNEITEELVNNLTFDNTMEIYKKTIDEDVCLINNNIKIRNDFQEYVKIENSEEYNVVKYNLYNEKKEVVSSFWITEMEQYINLLTSANLTIYGSDDKVQFDDDDRKYFLERNNINNDLDLLRYIKDNYYLENNLFTNVRNIKENYTINSFVQVTLPFFESITIISGDYTGYIYNLSGNTKEVHLIKNNKSYILTFIGNELTSDEYIKDLLSTLEIK